MDSLCNEMKCSPQARAQLFASGLGLILLPLLNGGVLQAAHAESRIEISLRSRYLRVFDGERQVARYPVAIGAPESPTPAGSYAITRMEEQPIYHKNGKVIAPGPSNPVGVRYMAYFQIGSGEYAIHGTAWPNWVKLRAAVSLGCIRMLNEDVVKVFKAVNVGTPVLVTSN